MSQQFVGGTLYYRQVTFITTAPPFAPGSDLRSSRAHRPGRHRRPPPPTPAPPSPAAARCPLLAARCPPPQAAMPSHVSPREARTPCFLHAAFTTSLSAVDSSTLPQRKSCTRPAISACSGYLTKPIRDDIASLGHTYTSYRALILLAYAPAFLLSPF